MRARRPETAKTKTPKSPKPGCLGVMVFCKLGFLSFEVMIFWGFLDFFGFLGFEVWNFEFLGYGFLGFFIFFLGFEV